MKITELLSEFAGTFLLVFIGTGSILFAEAELPDQAQLWIAVAFGLAVFLGIFLFGKWSGAHMNPAVTIGLWVKGGFPRNQVTLYIVAQLAGAIAASLMVGILFPQNIYLGDTLPRAGIWQSALLEFGLTLILMTGILWISGKKQGTVLTALFIAGIVGLEAYFAGPYCGASMNPARSFGPAMISGHLRHLWIYLFATTSGALIAGFYWRWQRSTE